VTWLRVNRASADGLFSDVLLIHSPPIAPEAVARATVPSCVPQFPVASEWESGLPVIMWQCPWLVKSLASPNRMGTELALVNIRVCRQGEVEICQGAFAKSRL